MQVTFSRYIKIGDHTDATVHALADKYTPWVTLSVDGRGTTTWHQYTPAAARALGLSLIAAADALAPVKEETAP